MKFLSFILLIVLCSTYSADAGAPLLHWGVVGPAAFKFRILPIENAQPYSVWGRYGIQLCALLEGTDDMALAFSGKAGVFNDVSQYSINNGVTFGLENTSVVIHPEVLLPTSFPQLKICAGFALDYKADSNMFIRNTADNTGPVRFDLDQIDSVIVRHERKLMPLLSCGIVYRIRNRVWLQTFIQQAMINTLPGGPTISFVNSSGKKDIKLHGQPTYLGLALWYYFN